MFCKNHPDAGATKRCTGCAESFCDNCVVELGGQHYCGACKVMAVGDRPLVVERGTRPCREASSALTLAIIGILLCSVIVSIWGIGLAIAGLVTAGKARGQIAGNAELTGSGKATAAVIVSVAALANALINIIGLVKG